MAIRRRPFSVLVATDGSQPARAAVAAAAAFPWPRGTRASGVVARQGFTAPAMVAQWPVQVWTALERGLDQSGAPRRRSSSGAGPGPRWPSSTGPRPRRSSGPGDGSGPAPSSWARRASGCWAGSSSAASPGRLPRRAVPGPGGQRPPAAGTARGARSGRLTARPPGRRAPRPPGAEAGQPPDGRARTRARQAAVPGAGSGGGPRGRPGSTDAQHAEALAAARREVETAARQLGRAGWRTRAQVRVGAPVTELLDAVRDSRADLVAVGARGVGAVERLVLGSVAEGVLSRAPVTVLVVREGR